jgi:hypothetical protein
MTNTLINCKISFLEETNSNILYAIFYEHSRNQFIKLSNRISYELVQGIHCGTTNISEIDFSNFIEDKEPSEEEIEVIYKNLLKKKNSGNSLRYKISKLEDFEIKAFELLSEKLTSYFRNEKLNSIGV